MKQSIHTYYGFRCDVGTEEIELTRSIDEDGSPIVESTKVLSLSFIADGEVSKYLFDVDKKVPFAQLVLSQLTPAQRKTLLAAKSKRKGK